MDTLKDLLEKLHVNPILASSVAIILVMLGWIYSQNWWGVRDKVNRFGRRPSEKSSVDLFLTIDTEDHLYEWKGDSRPLLLREVYVRMQNDGDTKITDILPHFKIEDDQNDLIFDSAQNFEGLGKVFELLPKKYLAFPIFDTLAKGPMKMDIQLLGVDSILNKKFKVTAFSEYHLPDDSRRHKTSVSTFTWSWYKPDTLKEEIKLNVYEQSTHKNSDTK